MTDELPPQLDRVPPIWMRPAPPRRRLVLTRVGLGLALGALAFRLVDLQVVRDDRYVQMAEKQRVRSMTLTAGRGEIVDRNGQVLAQNLSVRAIYADPKNVTDPAAQAVVVARILGLDAQEVQRKLERRGRFVYLARGIDPLVAKKIAAENLPGIGILPETKRVYPNGTAGASLIGFTDIDGLGLNGLESSYNSTLQGTNGTLRVEVDPRGRYIPLGEREVKEPSTGTGLQLTLDREITWFAQQALDRQVAVTGAKGGIVTVMDPRNGDILAWASSPTFDPNKPGASPAGAIGNRAVSEVFEPGSISKVVTIAGALEDGLVSPDDVITVPPGLRIHNKTFTDTHPNGTQRMTVTGILAESSNVGTIKISQMLGNQRLYEYLRKFGYGQQTGIGLPGESRGIVARPEDWSGTHTGTVPIGHGVSVTALQMASVYATVANGGTRVTPRIVSGTVAPDGKITSVPAEPGVRVISPQTAEALRPMLETVATSLGTSASAAVPGYVVAGKTGTARKVNSECRCYQGYMSSFVGYAPSRDARVVVQVTIDEPSSSIYGGAVAGPLFSEITQFALQRLGVPASDAEPSPVRLRE